MRAIARFANGDARTALNTLEMAVLNGEIMDEKAMHGHGQRDWHSVSTASPFSMTRTGRSTTI